MENCEAMNIIEKLNKEFDEVNEENKKLKEKVEECRVYAKVVFVHCILSQFTLDHFSEPLNKPSYHYKTLPIFMIPNHLCRVPGENMKKYMKELFIDAVNYEDDDKEIISKKNIEMIDIKIQYTTKHIYFRILYGVRSDKEDICKINKENLKIFSEFNDIQSLWYQAFPDDYDDEGSLIYI